MGELETWACILDPYQLCVNLESQFQTFLLDMGTGIGHFHWCVVFIVRLIVSRGQIKPQIKFKLIVDPAVSVMKLYNFTVLIIL